MSPLGECHEEEVESEEKQTRTFVPTSQMLLLYGQLLSQTCSCAAALKHRRDGVIPDLVTQLVLKSFHHYSKGRSFYVAPYWPCSFCILLLRTLRCVNY